MKGRTSKPNEVEKEPELPDSGSQVRVFLYLRTTRVLAAMSPRRCLFEEAKTATKPTKQPNSPSMMRSRVLMAAAPSPGTPPSSSRTTFMLKSIFPKVCPDYPSRRAK